MTTLGIAHPVTSLSRNDLDRWHERFDRPALSGKRANDIIDIIGFLEGEMADLLVRGIDEDLVRALKERAGAHGRSAEAEHREILAAALARPRRRSFAEVLASMPEVGADADFERAGSSGRTPDVFG